MQKYFRYTFPCVSLHTEHTRISQGIHLQDRWLGEMPILDSLLGKITTAFVYKKNNQKCVSRRPPPS
jgi:hypothetical protein